MNKILAGVVLGALLILPGTVRAATQEEIKTQIRTSLELLIRLLTQKLTLLQVQLKEMQEKEPQVANTSETPSPTVLGSSTSTPVMDDSQKVDVWSLDSNWSYTVSSGTNEELGGWNVVFTLNNKKELTTEITIGGKTKSMTRIGGSLEIQGVPSGIQQFSIRVSKGNKYGVVTGEVNLP